MSAPTHPTSITSGPVFKAQNANTAVADGGRVALFAEPLDTVTLNLSWLKQTLDRRNGGQTLITPYPTDYQPVIGYFQTTSGPQKFLTDQQLTQARVNWELPFADITAVSGGVRPPTCPRATSHCPSHSSSPTSTRPRRRARRRSCRPKPRPTSSHRRCVFASHRIGPWETLFGVFYTDERTVVGETLTAYEPAGSLIGQIFSFPTPNTYKEGAGFADVTYHFDERADLQVGGRYGEIKQTYRADALVTPAGAAYFGATQSGIQTQSAEHNSTWLVTPRYKYSDDLMFYSRAATGYRPGGPNPPGSPNLSVGPDTVTSFEVGAKGYAFDRRVTFQAALYDTEWNHIQLSVGTAAGLGFLANGGKARSRGLEGAVQYSPGHGWQLSGNLALTDATLVEDLPPNPLGPANPSSIGKKGDMLPDQAKVAANLGIEKSWHLIDDYRGTLGGNLAYVGARNQLFRTDAAPVARQGEVVAPAYEQLDLYAGISNGVWTLNFYARNVGSTHGIYNIQDGQGAGINTTASFIPPQTLGVLFSRNF